MRGAELQFGPKSYGASRYMIKVHRRHLGSRPPSLDRASHGASGASRPRADWV